MFRRRRFRPVRPLRRGGALPLGGPVPESLRKAMALLDQGKFDEAATTFDELAQEAEERGNSFRAANLTAQAARCYLQVEAVDAAYERGVKALELFKQAQRPGAARRVGERMVQVLRDRGRQAEAEALDRELKQLPVPSRAGAARGELPPKCLQCGGPIRESEAVWVGPSSAECPYCGSVVKAQ